MIRMDQIREYVILCETLNFSRTAELSYITQPALSRHIAAIEEEMGAQLLVRTTRTVEMTPAGKAVYDSFRSITSLFDLAKTQAADLSQARDGKLVIYSPYYCTAEYTEPLIREFSKDHPLCGISIVPCQPIEGFEAMKAGRCDLLVSIDMPDCPDSIEKLPFACEDYLVFMSQSHRLASRSSISFEDFDGEVLVYTQGFEQARDGHVSLMAMHDARPSKTVCCEQIEELAMLLERTGGLIICPASVRNMGRSYIASVPLDTDEKAFMYVFHRKDPHNPMVERFLDSVSSGVGHS